MRRNKTSHITVNICPSITSGSPARSSSTVNNRTPSSIIKINTNNRTPIQTPIKTQISNNKTNKRSSIQTPIKTPIRNNKINENDQSTANSRKNTNKVTTKNTPNGRQSLNSTDFRTPPAYNLRRQHKSTIINTMYTMSDSKIDKKSQTQLKRSHQEDNAVELINQHQYQSQRNENSVIVAIRVRPLNCRELNPENANLPIIVNSEENTIKVKDKNSQSYLEFSFDHCFNSTKPSSFDYASQEKVYLSLCKPLFDKIFAGINVCCFTYGQTGSGKSHTIMGTNDNNGLIPRFAREFFNQTRQHEKKLVIEASYYEIYNEKIHDLLADIKSLVDKKPLKIRERPDSGPYVENLSVHMINSIEDLFNILIKGNKNKATASTLLNDRSSRSHVIFNLNIYEQRSCKNEENSAKKKTFIQLLSKINFIDLAGSERASVLGSTGDRLKEGNLINKSLLTLGKVINLLSSSDQSSSNQHIPYRESTLTYLLKDCLGGNSYTCMIATISPSIENLEESLSTLRYASKARRIVNKIKQNKPTQFDNSEIELEYENKLIKVNELIKKDLDSLKEIVLNSCRPKFVDKINQLFSDMID